MNWNHSIQNKLGFPANGLLRIIPHCSIIILEILSYLGPAEKGMKACECLFAEFSGENLKGSNICKVRYSNI